MCVKLCLCNSCYKKKNCSDCEYIDEHKEDECCVKGITYCVHYEIR
jgi:hypothetical protein